MSKSSTNCIVICGPTATGKTRLGVQVAAWLDGEILSADSRQVYRGMDIGTGKDLEEYEIGGKRIPHHLIDVAEPAEVYSLWNYQQDFYAAFVRVREKARVPVIVGGSGLYIEAVLRHYRIADVPENAALRRELMEQPAGHLLERLAQLDPDLLEQTDVSSKKRIIRSLEIAIHAQDHEVSWGIPNPPEIAPLILVVDVPRPELRERIRSRLESRFEEGMIGEVGKLIDAGVTRERLDQLGMEYGHIGRFLAGEVGRERMEEDLFTSICQLAKRQVTWFRGMERRGLAVVRIEEADFEAARAAIGERAPRLTANRPAAGPGRTGDPGPGQ